MAQCWLQLKGWEFAKNEIQNCLNRIGSQSNWKHVKVKCDKFLKVLKDISSIGNYVPPLELFQNMAFLPEKAIENLHLNKSKPPELTPLLSDQWNAMFNEWEEKKVQLEKQLNSTKEFFKHEINTLNFFELHSIILSQDSVKIPLTFFFQVCPFVAVLFFGEFASGMEISFDSNEINRKIQSKHPLRIAYSFSAIFEQSKPQLKKLIHKYVYCYLNNQDIAFNQEFKNPTYGSSQGAYDDMREDNRIRTALFYPDDIVGKSIMDCGCNEGLILFECRNMGATTITGFDFKSMVHSAGK